MKRQFPTAPNPMAQNLESYAADGERRTTLSASTEERHYENRVEPNCKRNYPMNAMESWELQIMKFEERLRPIAQRPVEVTRPGWFERSQASVPPLDEAG